MLEKHRMRRACIDKQSRWTLGVQNDETKLPIGNVYNNNNRKLDRSGAREKVGSLLLVKK